MIMHTLAAWKDLELKRFSPHDNSDVLQSALENVVNDNMIAPMLAHKPKNAVDFPLFKPLMARTITKIQIGITETNPKKHSRT